MRLYLCNIFRVTATVLVLHLAKAMSTNNTGGCTTYITQGLSLGLCISNMNGMALPNLFVDTSRIYILGTINCRMYIETWDDQGNMYDSTPASCTTGVHLVLPIGPFSNNVILHSFSRVYFGSNQDTSGSSPPVAILPSTSLSYSYRYFIASPPPPPQNESYKWQPIISKLYFRSMIVAMSSASTRTVISEMVLVSCLWIKTQSKSWPSARPTSRTSPSRVTTRVLAGPSPSPLSPATQRGTSTLMLRLRVPGALLTKPCTTLALLGVSGGVTRIIYEPLWPTEP